jgi:FKBP-type peptidyl-prolyl cis-trans isomerase SlyD
MAGPVLYYGKYKKREVVMIVAKNKAVTLDYTLSDETGETLETSKGKEPLTYIHGSGGLIRGFEAAMDGKSAKDAFSFTVKPEDGYGERRDELLFQATREQLKDIPDLAIGMPLRVQTPQGALVVTIAGFDGDKVLLDGNHPLAGKELTFAVEVLDVRDATTEELQEAMSSHSCGGSCGDSCGDSCGQDCCE